MHLNFDTARLDALPAPPNLASADLADRVRGMLLGVAIGDALENRSESMNPSRRSATFG